MSNPSVTGLSRTFLPRALSLSCLLFLAVMAGFLSAAGTPAMAQKAKVPAWLVEKRANPTETKSILNKNRLEWCFTDQNFERRHPRLSSRITGVCEPLGPADTPAVRDAAIPTAATPFKVIRVKFNILANDDGSNPTATQAQADGQLAQLNADFAASKIRFVSVGTRFCNSTRFRNITNLTTELDALKLAFNDQPTKNLNFYVTEVEQASPVLLGMATFAWDPDAISAYGGFFCDNDAFGAGERTATHEIGHCLGLWHPFHGVEEVAGCTNCRELVGRSAADGDITGDLASDTPPTSKNYNCGPPTDDPETPVNEAVDECSANQPWGTTDVSNFMAYADDTCIDHFTAQQNGRMHAWINDKLSGWLVGTDAADPPIVVSPTVGTSVGSGPIVVKFSKAMNTASTQAAFTISPAAAGTFAWSDGNKTLTYTMGALPSGTIYTITIKGSAQSAASAAITLDGNGNEVSQGTPADDYTFSLRTPGAAGNDNFANATALAGNTGNMAGSNTGATKETGEPSHYFGSSTAGTISSAGNSVWYKWTTGVVGNANIRIDSTIGPTVAVYEGTALTTLTLVTRSGIGTPNLNWRTVAGRTYFIVVDSLYYVPSSSPPLAVTTGVFTINWKLAPSPANDNMANATSITGTAGFVNGNNEGAYYEDTEPYSHSGRDSSMWYRWTAPANGAVTFDTEGSAFDTVLGAYSGTAPSSGTFLAGDDEGGTGTLSKMPFTVVAGSTYTIIVGGDGSGLTNSARGNFKLNWALTAAPANDLFANAITLAPAGGTVAGSNIGANKETGEPDRTFGYGFASIWYNWTAPSSGVATFSTAGSSFNTQIGIYTGSVVNGLTEVDFNQDDATNAPVTTSRVKFTAVAGTVYRIKVDNGGYGGSVSEASVFYPATHGATSLTWSLIAAPANDLFANATTMAVAGGSVTGTNVGASVEVGEDDFTFGYGKASIWYKWTPTANGVVTIDTAGSKTLTGLDFNTSLGVYTGNAVNGLTDVAENNDDAGSAPLNFSKVKFTAVAGITYRIRLDNGGYAGGDSAQFYDATHGTLKLNWSFLAAPANDLFANATAIAANGGAVQGTNVGANVEAGEQDFTFGYGKQSIWYKWTAPSNGVATFTTEGSKTTTNLDFNTSLGVYTGPAVNALTDVAENNDDAANAPLTFSKVKFTALAGTTYFLRLDNGGYASGDSAQYYDAVHGTLALSWGFVPAPANDMFDDAQEMLPVNSGRIDGTNVGATNEVGENDPTFGYAKGSIWYKWTAPGAGNVTIDTLGSAIDTHLAVYTGGTVGGLDEVISNNDAGALKTSSVTFAAQGGTEYRIRIDNGGYASGDVSQYYDATHGNIVLRWTYGGAAIQAPQITGFTPASGGSGTSVTITGNFLTGATSVKFNGLAASITSNSATQIVATVPAGALTGRISVTTANGTGLSATNFQVPPTIANFTPASGAIGAAVTINGTGFTQVSSVKFNGVTAPFGVNSLSQIVANVPLGATTGKITVTTTGGTATSASNFTAPPQVTGFTPGGGTTGSVVVITGINFTGATGVQFNTSTATFTVNSATQITATVPSGTTTGPIKVTTAAGLGTSATNFVIEAAPTITSFSPTSADEGALITINGTNLVNSSTAIPTVKFYNNRTSLDVTVISPTKITATIPVSATTGPISVTTTGGTFTTASFLTVGTTPPPTAYTISGRITTSAAVAISGVSVSRTGGATVTTNATGDYTFTNVFPGAYTLTPAKAGTVFTPAARNVTVASANLTGQNFTGVLVPTITNFTPTSGMAAASVTITGTNFTGATSVKFNGTTATFTVGSATSITTTVPAGATTGTLSVTTPAGTATSAGSFTVLGTYSITGRIATAANVAISGVSVTRTGSATAAVTNASGDYTFTGLPNGTYTLTPAKAGYLFTPVNRSAVVSNANLTAQNFTGTPAPTVTGFSPTSATAGTSVTITGTNFTGATVVKFNTTNATFAVNSATSIVATVPAGATTGKISVTTPGGTATSANNFTVNVTYTITGRITNAATGGGIGGVTVARTGSAATVITNASGDYAIGGVPPGTVTVVPSLARYVFTPANRSVTVTNANVTAQNFTGVGSIYSIRGRFANNSNVGINGAQITCTGKANAIVDANGDFVFENLPPGNYTVAPLITPALSGVTLSPASRAVTISTSNLSNISFTASFSVNGRLSNHSGVGIPNVQIQRIAGASVVSVFTDAQGYYRFTAVRSGDYTVAPVLTPAMAGMSFSPASINITVAKINLTNINFTGLFSISGRVADASNVGIPSIQVRRTIGASTITAVTDASGNYRFGDTRSGDYTITPVAAGRTFTPASRSVSVSVSQISLINQNFTGTGSGTPPPASYNVTGRVVNSTNGAGIAGVSVTRTGSASAVVTNSTGDYTFTGVVAGTYTITPSLSGYSFTPVNRSVTVSNANITVANFIGAANAVPAPTITSFTPTSGPVGTSVVITGTNLTGATAVRFNGTVATTFTVNSATQITATVPTGATTGVVNATTSGGTGASATNFTVTVPSPTVTGFTPTSGPVGTSVVITGTNFTGATAVKFDVTNATTFTVNSATQITATVPTGAVSGKISVTTPGGTGLSAANFTVTVPTPAPTVTGFTPTSGPVGTSVVITGTNFTGATVVKFNATNAVTFTVNSATQITATVPTGATTGKVSVTTPGGTGLSAANFTVTVVLPPAFVNNFADARFITGASGTLTGSNVGYTRETNEPTLVGNSGGASAWVKWTAPSTGNFVFTTAGSSFDTMMGIVTGNSLETLTGFANDDENPGVILTSRMVQAATAGTTYYIVIDGYDGVTGNITLSWSLE